MRFHDVPDAFHKQEDCKKRGIFRPPYRHGIGNGSNIIFNDDEQL